MSWNFMIDRRDFLKTVAAAGSAALLNPRLLFGTPHLISPEFFGVHPFIENNPDAVFIMRTDVDTKRDSEKKKQAGLAFGKSVFVPLSENKGGVPLTNNVVIKPNLTGRGKWMQGYTVERSMGVVTDVYFVEGVIEALKTLGIRGNQMYMREVNSPEDWAEGGYTDMAQRTGVDLKDMSAKVGKISEDELVWKDVENGVWFLKIPYLRPVNASNTFLINIAKFKAYGMGLTLTAKNLQGTIAHNYQQHCKSYYSDMDMSPEHIVPNAKATIMENYKRHVAEGIPRWDRLGSDGGIWQETWASWCLDNNSVTKPNLHVIEGIYGHDGDFIRGPSLEDDIKDGFATDYITNVIIFGKNPFYVDIIGHWLGGHEPGNFGLFHLAKERGFISLIDPTKIPVYEWKADGNAVLTPLANFDRTPLKTYYLQRDYNGQSEPYWHLCNEPYDYNETGIDLFNSSDRPRAFVLFQNYPNPFNPSTSIEFRIPKSGFTKLEIFNTRGEIVDILVNKYWQKGSHMVVWNPRNYPSGIYFYRLRFGSFNETKRMVLLR